MKMNKKLTKRILAVALSAVVALTTVFTGTPVTANAAAAKTSITSFKSVKAENTVKYTIKNLKKGQYAKVTFSGTAKGNVLVKKGESKITSGKTKVVGTGNDIVLNVTATNKAAGKNYTLTVKTYKAKNDNLVSTTATGSVFVYKLCTGITLDKATADVKVGETVTLTATKTPENTTQKVTWTTSDEKIATVANGVVTAVAAGTATITVKCGKVTATCEVKVAEKLEAVQTGANEITIKGAKSDKLADYSVKRGTSTVSLKSVRLADGTVVLTAMTSVLPKGDYTLTYDGKTVEFKVEAATLTSIELTPNTLIKDDASFTSGSTATLSFVCLDQFGKPINVSGVNVSTMFGSKAANMRGGVGSAQFTIGTALVGTTTRVVLVETATGVTTQKDVTIGSMRAVKKAELKGLYNTVTKKEIVLLPGTNAANANAAMLFNVVDQYGDSMNTLTGANVTLSESAGTTGLTKGTANTVVTLADGNDYVAVTLTGTAAAGTYMLNIIENSSGIVGNGSIVVGYGAIVKTFTVSPSENLYANSPTTFSFSALDADGKEITDVTTLSALISGSEGGNNVSFTADKAGKVSLNYTPTTSGMKVIVFQLNPGTPNTAVQTMSITVGEQRIPTAVIGIDKTAATVITNNNSSTLNLKCQDLIIEDQYGNVMSDDLVAASGFKFITAVTGNIAGLTAISSSTALTKATDVVAPTTAMSTEATGSVTITLQKNNGTAIANSAYTVALNVVSIEKVSEFAVAPIALQKAGVGFLPTVTGKYLGQTVLLGAGEYVVAGFATSVAGQVLPPTISAGKETRTADLKLIMTNKAASEVKTTFQYSNEDPKATSIVASGATATATGVTEIQKRDFIKTIKILDQYGAEMAITPSAGLDMAIQYKLVSPVYANGTTNVVAGTTVRYNNTHQLTISNAAFTTGLKFDMTIAYTLNGITFEQDITITMP
ncbi:MAG: Ig-like domain-containing protein [Lachnospiraceae bacterium]